MSPLTLLISILGIAAIIYIIRYIVRARGMSRATKILLPTSVALSIPGIILLLVGNIEIGLALTGLAGAMTLLEGNLRHKAERKAALKGSQNSNNS